MVVGMNISPVDFVRHPPITSVQSFRNVARGSSKTRGFSPKNRDRAML
jgi:hypothetical protein